MNDTIFRFAAALIFLVGAGISTYHRRRANREGGDKITLKEEGLAMVLALRVTGLVMWGCILAYLIHPAWVAGLRVDLPDWLRWVGVGLGLAADALAYWVFTSLGNNVSPTVITRQNHELVTHGPYRWVRHPLYSMGMLAYLGFALLSGIWLIAVLGAVGFVLLNLRLPNEEAHLIERFGAEYQAYMQRTGKFFPRLGR